MLLHAFFFFVFICLRLSLPLSLFLSLCLQSCLLGKNAVTFYVCTLPLTTLRPSLHNSPFPSLSPRLCLTLCPDTPFGILLDLSYPLFPCISTYFYYFFNTFSALGK